MSAEEFWKNDPQLFVAYRTSFINKKKRELEEYDYKCWLQGLYIHDGNGKLTLSLKQFIGNMMSKTKDNTIIGTYPSEPYNSKPNKKDNKVEETKKQEEYRNSLIYYGTIKARYLEKMKSKKESDN